MPAAAAAAPEPSGRAAPHLDSVVGAIGPKIRELRRRQGMTLQQLAHHADVSAASVHKVERGTMVPTITTLLKLAAALDVPARHFVEDEEVAGTLTRFGDAEDGPVQITGPAERFRAEGTASRLRPGEGWTAEPRPGEVLLLVLAGAAEVALAGETTVVSAGEAFHLPTGSGYGVTNTADEVTEVVRVEVPGT